METAAAWDLAAPGLRQAWDAGDHSMHYPYQALPGQPRSFDRVIDCSSTMQGEMMEFLVTMTTHVPAGTLDESVNDVRTREAARSRELAAQGHLARLWRPALKPGEWRTLGLFAAEDEPQLEKVLASMPLRVWRSDEVTALSPHPNDPGRARTTPNQGPGTEFLIAMTITVPKGTPDDVVADTESREKQRARELAGQDHLVRLWALPGRPDGRRTVGLWRARDAEEMTAVLESLPLYDWMTIETTPLTEHPNDPADSNAAGPRHP